MFHRTFLNSLEDISGLAGRAELLAYFKGMIHGVYQADDVPEFDINDRAVRNTYAKAISQALINDDYMPIDYMQHPDTEITNYSQHQENDILIRTYLNDEIVKEQKLHSVTRQQALQAVIQKDLASVINPVKAPTPKEEKASSKSTTTSSASPSSRPSVSSTSSSHTTSTQIQTQTQPEPVVSSDDLAPAKITRSYSYSGEYSLVGFQGSTEVSYAASFATGTQKPVWDHEDHSTVTIKKISENVRELTIDAHPKKAGAPRVGVQESYQLKLHLEEEKDTLVISHIESVKATAKLPVGSVSLSGYKLQGQKIPINLKHDEKHQGHIHLDSTINLNELNINSVLRKTFGMFSNPIHLKAKLVKKDATSTGGPSNGKK